MKFPTWVPDWVREEYLSIEAICNGDFNDENWVEWYDANGCQYILPVLRKIVESESMRLIWRALEKRRTAVEKRTEYDDKFWWTDGKTLGFITESVLDGKELFGRLHRIDNSDPTKRLTKSRTAELGREIANAAETLSTKLQEAHFDDEKGAFRGLREAIEWQIENCMDNAERELEYKDRTLFPWDLRGFLDPVLKAQFLENFTGLLKLIAEGARESQPVDAMLGKPNGDNAERTYLLRHLSITFTKVYNSPLNEVNLAITSTQFDCDGLSAANVATIVRGARKQSPKT